MKKNLSITFVALVGVLAVTTAGKSLGAESTWLEWMQGRSVSAPVVMPTNQGDPEVQTQHSDQSENSPRIIQPLLVDPPRIIQPLPPDNGICARVQLSCSCVCTGGNGKLYREVECALQSKSRLEFDIHSPLECAALKDIKCSGVALNENGKIILDEEGDDQYFEATLQDCKMEIQ